MQWEDAQSRRAQAGTGVIPDSNDDDFGDVSLLESLSYIIYKQCNTATEYGMPTVCTYLWKFKYLNSAEHLSRLHELVRYSSLSPLQLVDKTAQDIFL